MKTRFFSPVLPMDLCRSSVPLSYLQVTYKAIDGHLHNIQLYSNIDATWLAGGDATVRWDFDCPGSCGPTDAYFRCSSNMTGVKSTLCHGYAPEQPKSIGERIVPGKQRCWTSFRGLSEATMISPIVASSTMSPPLVTRRTSALRAEKQSISGNTLLRMGR